MAYDPAEDPRYIPLDDLEERREAEREDSVALVEEQLYQLDQMLRLFEHPGWEMVATRIAREREVMQGQADKTYENAAWHFIRGQVIALDYFLSLPARMDTVRKGLLQQARDLAPPSGEEASA